MQAARHGGTQGKTKEQTNLATNLREWAQILREKTLLCYGSDHCGCNDTFSSLGLWQVWTAGIGGPNGRGGRNGRVLIKGALLAGFRHKVAGWIYFYPRLDLEPLCWDS